MKKVLTVNIKSHIKHSKIPVYGFTITDLCTLFKRSKVTIKRWIKSGKIDPTDLESIIQLYNSVT